MIALLPNVDTSGAMLFWIHHKSCDIHNLSSPTPVLALILERRYISMGKCVRRFRRGALATIAVNTLLERR